MCSEGTEVRWVQSFFLPEVEQTHRCFEANDEGTIKDLNDRAQIPFESINEVMEMTPDVV